ncbi:T7SS effector LXG polymorphic toxin [Bacillus sp. UMB0893]|uniref:T7SS effector LXG polymorphic toxin n=1 Tax=Bacillus sp. UMB0893 TaxID=2066053 RepID=UPI000C77E07F|nr:T7SS effector LXG polymorphic toxin [Bacillus sp. UMB0893]PLR66493.1 transposase [Bacillus sp. UMB0893]
MAEIKVYEAKTLVSAMEKRAKQYEELKEQLNQLKKQFLDIVNSGDEFQGKGAEAIKGFYSAQVDVVEAWMRLIDKNIAFFRGIPGSTEDAKLSGDTFVQMSFLEENVPRAQNRAKEMVESQQDALQNIFHSIDDLVPLHVFSSDSFEDHMAKAEKERSQTVDAVNQLDQALTEEYAISENDQSYLLGLFGQLLESSRQGSSITPINFNAKAYQNSEIYKMKKDIENSSKEYLAFKNDQAEARKQAKIAEELENRPWYEKAWDTTKTFTGEVSGYYDYKRATEGVDPVTGEKLTEAQRIAAGAMAAAGFIPVVGWAGRAVKGGSAIYKTVKAYNAADHALDAYKTSKSFSALQKTEMGIYGLVSANGLGEAVTGKDMFGNQLTEEQRNQSLFNAIAILGVAGAGYGFDRLAAKNTPLVKVPYSNKYVQEKLAVAQQSLKAIGNRIGDLPVPVFRMEEMVTNIGVGVKQVNVEMKPVRDVMQMSSSGRMGSTDTVTSNQANRLIPGKPGHTNKGNSTELGKNLMESMGFPRSLNWKGYQAQHIIPKNLYNHPIIKKIGMEMDHSSNGIFLPIPHEEVSALSRHRGFHSVYNNVVKDQLDKLDLNQNVEVLEKQVYDLQQKLKRGTELGIPLYRSKVTSMGIELFYKSGKFKDIPIWQRGGGATEDLWERWLSK